MPLDALTALDATLDAATSIADTQLAEGGGALPRRLALQRAAVVLCATAWEAYVENSLSWVGARAGASVADARQLAAATATAHLAVLSEQADRAVPAGFAAAWDEKYRSDYDTEYPGRFDEDKRSEQEWLDNLTWSWRLEVFLRRRIVGPPLWGGPRCRHDEPSNATDKLGKPIRFGIDGLGKGAMPAPRFDTVTKWQRAIYRVPFIEQVRLPRFRDTYVAHNLNQLTVVRNASVHRGETPGALHTRGVWSWIWFVHDVAHELDRLILEWADQHLPLNA